MMGGLGREFNGYQIVNISTAGNHAVTTATTTQTIFTAPERCEIVDVLVGVTTTISAGASDYWTVALTNQTGDAALLSYNFTTCSAIVGGQNGGKAITADTMTSVCNGSDGNEFLQNNILEKGDHLQIVLTKVASGANLVYPVCLVIYKL